MPEKFKFTRRVEFRDTDMAGIVHFSNFFAYMEQAEHEFLRSIGLGVVWDFHGKKISWPRVNVQCNYKSAIRFEEMIDIAVSVKRIGSKSVTYAFDFFRDEMLVAHGEMTAACCELDHGVPPQSVAIPSEFVAAIQPFAPV
jgi:acyl-CoA thioester hydrolase